MEKWPYADYDAYLTYQSRRARRTRGVTRKYGHLRERLMQLMRKFAPDVNSVLCLGARNPLEVEHFRAGGYEAEGIDLYNDTHIYRCDMADLDASDRYRTKSFDAFIFIHSLEHCFDLPGFRVRSLPHCRKAVAVAIPLQDTAKVSEWDCTALTLQNRDADQTAFTEVFPGFSLIHREIIGGVLVFLMIRRELNVADQVAEAASIPTNSAGMSTTQYYKNVLVANYSHESKYSRDALERLLNAQIDNSIEVGWLPNDIIVATNFPYRARGVEAVEIDLNKHCLRGSKMFVIDWLLRQSHPEDSLFWVHDLDCWQNLWFDPPLFADVGASEYSRPTFNGGSVFWRLRGRDIAAEIVGRLKSDQALREEPTINRVFKSRSFRHRVTKLNSTFNVGSSGYKERLHRSIKPVRASHFRPTSRRAWATHALDKHGYGATSVSPRLKVLLRRWYPDLPE